MAGSGAGNKGGGYRQRLTGICLEWEIMVGSKGQEAVECTECRWLGAVIKKCS